MNLVFQMVGGSHKWSLYLRMVGKGVAKNYYPVSLLSLVSKVFEKLVNNRFVDHLEKCGLFSDFQYGFRSSQSTTDHVSVVSDRIARAFNRSAATRVVALDTSKAFNRFWHDVPLHKLKACVCYFLSNFYFFTKRWPFRNYEKCFLFHRKSYFCSRDIQIFVIFSHPFHTFQIQKGKWKWNNL